MTQHQLSDGLRAAMETQANRSKQRGCSVGQTVAHLAANDPEAATIIAEWLATPQAELGHARLAAALRQAGIVSPTGGHPLTGERIGNHRLGHCSCSAAGLR